METKAKVCPWEISVDMEPLEVPTWQAFQELADQVKQLRCDTNETSSLTRAQSAEFNLDAIRQELASAHDLIAKLRTMVRNLKSLQREPNAAIGIAVLNMPSEASLTHHPDILDEVPPEWRYRHYGKCIDGDTLEEVFDEGKPLPERGGYAMSKDYRDDYELEGKDWDYVAKYSNGEVFRSVRYNTFQELADLVANIDRPKTVPELEPQLASAHSTIYALDDKNKALTQELETNLAKLGSARETIDELRLRIEQNQGLVNIALAIEKMPIGYQLKRICNIDGMNWRLEHNEDGFIFGTSLQSCLANAGILKPEVSSNG